jgi:hypothetical protein
MDCLYCVKTYVPSSNGYSYALGLQQRTATLPTAPSGSTIGWAIGGFDLMVDSGTTYADSNALAAALNNRFSTGTPPNYTGNITTQWLPGYANRSVRSVIAYKGSELIFGTFFNTNSPGTDGSVGFTNGLTVFELYAVMKSMSCTKVLLIDGGHSGKVQFKESGNTAHRSADATESVYCQIALYTSVSNSCDWNGQD